MIINIVIPGVGLTGGIQVVFTYAEYLKKHGHDVMFYTPLKAYDVKNSNNELKNSIHVITNTIKRIWRYKIIKKYKTISYDVEVNPVLLINDSTIRDADITIATAWPTAYSVNKLVKNKGIKIYFVQGYEVWNNEILGKKSYTLDLHKITISKWINDQLTNQLGGSGFPVVFDGIDLERFNANKKINEDGSNFHFLMLYNDLPNKGVSDGLVAFENVKKEYPNIKLSMFGMKTNPNLPPYVEYFNNPSKDEIKYLYESADVFIFPSLEEGWGLTPLEAMASSCAVVGYNTGCMIDIGVDNENVLLSLPGDVNMLKQNIRKLIENPILAQKIAQNGHITVQQFSWEKCAYNFEQVLEEIFNAN